MSQSTVLKGVVCAVMLLSLSCSAMQQAIVPNNTSYKVLEKGQWNQVKSYNVDPILRKMSKEQLCEFFAAGCKIKANKCSNGDYVLYAFVPGKGGAVGGAIVGAYVGKYGTYALGHGAIIGASLLTGWGFFASFAALEGQFALTIEAASNTAAIALGVTFAVATGPV